MKQKHVVHSVGITISVTIIFSLFATLRLIHIPEGFRAKRKSMPGQKKLAGSTQI